MDFFERYVSNTVAGSGSQTFFRMEAGEVRTGRVFYKIRATGRYRYALLFSNILDSTFADGSVSHAGMVCDAWHIHGARVGVCRSMPRMTLDGEVGGDIPVSDWQTLAFNGAREKEVMPAEIFPSDGVMLSLSEGDRLCLEVTFSGGMIPYHEESLLPVFVRTAEGWRYDKRMPFASMVGCERRVTERIAYIGDSITQGIGTPPDSYTHWNAVLSDKLGDGYAFWNLGLGYARASDAALDGSWLYKAKKNDTVFVCFGVNDILRGHTADRICADLARIVALLKAAGKRVILQTVPPFDYTGNAIEVWQTVNAFIKRELVTRVDALFDNGTVLSRADAPHSTRFGGHPNEEGCRLWAEALWGAVSHLF